MIGIELHAARVEPLFGAFTDRAQYDNQFVAYLMIDPAASFQPFSSDDASLVDDFIHRLLDKYIDGEVSLSRDISPAAFRRSKMRSLEFERWNDEDVQQSEDISI